MPIDPEFPRNQQVIGRHYHADGQHYHFIWGPGSISDVAANEDVMPAHEEYKIFYLFHGEYARK